MNLGYGDDQLKTAFTREARHDHHHEHEHHQGPESPSAAGDAGGTGGTRSGTCGHGGHGGAMIFHVGYKETILFEFWQTKSSGELLLSCLVIFIVALLYEALKCYREWLKKCDKKRLEGGANRKSRSNRPHISILTTSSGHPPPTSSVAPAPTALESEPQSLTERLPWLSPMHWFQTMLHMVQVTISFMLMLIFMTFNVWLCIAVVAGAGIGYFIFFARRENVSDHCN